MKEKLNVRPTPELVPIALFAGKGDLPRLLISHFQSQNRPFVVLAFKGQTEEDLVKNVPHLSLHFGEVGKALAYMAENQIQEIVMAGSMFRPAISEIRPDWEGIKWLGKIGKKALGDDNLLKLVIQMLEDKGYKIVGPDSILAELLTPEGVLTFLKPDAQALQDIQRGLEILSALDQADVGQAVVIQEGLVLGIEAIEGTDSLIERAGELKRPGLGGILVKRAKRQQEKRVDLPTIGLETIHKASRAKLRGIAVEAGRTLMIGRNDILNHAQEKGLFVLGLKNSNV